MADDNTYLSPQSYRDREARKFREDADGNVAVKTISEIIGAVEASFQFQGFSKAMKTTTMEVSDVPIPLPATALTDRNSLTIRNLDETYTLYIGDSVNVEANRDIGTLGGDEIGPEESSNLPIANGLVVYGVVESGQTIKVKITEYA